MPFFPAPVRFGRRRFFRVLPAALTVLFAATALSVAPPVESYEYEPILLDVDDSFMPGDLVDCRVELTGVPENIHITSSPSGVISYHGPVSSANSTVTVQSNPNASAGPVTVYLTVTGNSTVSDSALVDAADDPEL